MIGWIILILAIVAIFFLIKMKHLKHQFWIILALLFLVFIYLSFTSVIKANDIDLKSPSGIFAASKLYFSWIWHAFSNVKVLTGNAVRMEWFGNSTG